MTGAPGRRVRRKIETPSRGELEVGVKIEDVPYTSIDWSRLQPAEQPGQTGSVTSRGVEAGNLRVRLLDFGPGYMADHWCERGHVAYVIDGEVVNELSDGTTSVLSAGMSFAVADGKPSHRTFTRTGARVFIVD
jgi:hypothetical protein